MTDNEIRELVRELTDQLTSSIAEMTKRIATAILIANNSEYYLSNDVKYELLDFVDVSNSKLEDTTSKETK